ncbi:MAG TPA: NAD(P)/FAD-dependent oxidoreductase [Vicinamibacterales bacterium]|nr:NAD(P)/FAD-dependent oxidoreductase [Vicinamibacterales bacterium]
MAHLPQVIIIGGGFAGLAAARRLKNVECEVTIIDRHNHHVFQPLLYQVATAGLSPGDIASPIRWILRKQPRLRVLLARVERIDPIAKRVALDGGDAVPYDYLIVAAGTTHSYFGHDDWAAAAPGLKTLDDALSIRRRLLLAFEEAEREPNPVYQRRLLTFVLIGGGPTGVEMAGALGEIARHALNTEFDAVDPAIARIILIEAGPSILPAFPEDLRASAHKALLRLGVDVRVGKAVTRVEEGAVWIGEDRIDAHNILWAAGVAAAPISRDLGPNLDRAGRVIVEPDLSVPTRPEIFVAGDLATFTHQTGKPLPGVAQVAKQQGRHAAANIARLIAGTKTTTFRYFDPGNMATIGRNAAIADFGFLHVSGYPGWLLWLFVHIMFLIGFRNRVSVMLQWAAAYLTYQRSVRLITRNTS